MGFLNGSLNKVSGTAAAAVVATGMLVASPANLQEAEAITTLQVTTSVTDIPDALIGSGIAVGDSTVFTVNFDETALGMIPPMTVAISYPMDSWNIDLGSVSISGIGGTISIGDNLAVNDLVIFSTNLPYVTVGDTGGIDPIDVELRFTGDLSFLSDSTLSGFLAVAHTVEPSLNVFFDTSDADHPLGRVEFGDRELVITTTPDVPMATVPEPITATLGLMGLGVLGLATRRRAA